MADHLSDAELVSRMILARDLGNAKAAAQLGINVRNLQTSLSTGKARGLSSESKVVDELGKAKQTITQLRAEIAGLYRVAETEETVRKRIYNLSNLEVDPPVWTQRRPKSIKNPGVPMTIWSDWHWGETVSATEVGGVNAFNLAIGRERVRRLVDTTISLAKDHMVRPSYPGIVVCLGGDMITGDIHEELAVTNWGTTQEQFLQVQEELTTALAHMADAFGRVFVPCVVGNHGRGTLRPRFKQRVLTSYEWNLYNQLERTFRKDKRFRFMIPGETDAFFSVYGHRFMLTHGDTMGVKGGDGIIGALGPITRGAIKVGRSEAQIGRDFDTLIIGHWHTYLGPNDCTSVIVNGALKGYDEFARLALRARYSRPTQAMWFVHPDHGITASWPIYLDHRRKAVDNSQWLTFMENK